MLLATYQPLHPEDSEQNPQYDCFRDRLDGEYPVFCFPTRTADEFRFRSLLAAPCKPERLVIFETDGYVRFDAVTWNNILTLPRGGVEFSERFRSMFVDVDERFSEYVVRPGCLSSPVIDLDIRQLIEDDEIRMSNADVADDMIRELQERAHDAVIRSLPDSETIQRFDRNDVLAMLYQTAFVFYLSGAMWNVATGSDASLVDLIPFMPNEDSETSISAWERFNVLRDKVFDTSLGGTHDEYVEMCAALETAVSSNRQRFLSCFPRNGLCPCGSGRKFKKCHGVKSVELFPFQ